MPVFWHGARLPRSGSRFHTMMETIVGRRKHQQFNAKNEESIIWTSHCPIILVPVPFQAGDLADTGDARGSSSNTIVIRGRVLKKIRIRAALDPLVRVIQDYRFYTMSLRQYHWCCQYHESMSIPWIHVYTMSSYLYYEAMSIQWFNTNYRENINRNTILY